MKVIKKDGKKYFGERNGEVYEIKDDDAKYFYDVWNNNPADKVAGLVMSNRALWETDLTQLPGFLHAVNEQLKEMIQSGVLATVTALVSGRVEV